MTANFRSSGRTGNAVPHLLSTVVGHSPERYCGRAEDRLMAVHSQCQTSALGRDLSLDMWVLLYRLSDQL